MKSKFDEFIEDESVIEEVNEKILIDLQEENIKLITKNAKLKITVYTLLGILSIILFTIAWAFYQVQSAADNVL